MPYKNIEEKRKRDREYYRRNRKRRIEIGRIWREKNKEKIKMNNKKYRDEHKEELSVYRKKWWEKKLGRKILPRKINTFKKEFIKDDFALGYVLGVLEGDGCFGLYGRGGIGTLSVTDKDFADAFEKELKKIYPYHIFRGVGEPKGVSKKKKYIVNFNSKSYVKFFKRMIEKIIELSDKIKRGFLKGMYDSEGSVYLTNLEDRKRVMRQISFTQKSKETINLMTSLLEYFNVGYKTNTIKGSGFNPNGIYYSIRIFGRNNFIRFKEVIGFSIGRKADKLKIIIDSYILNKDCIICKKKIKMNGKNYGQLRCNKCNKEYWKQYNTIKHREYSKREQKNKYIWKDKFLKPTPLINICEVKK